MRLFLFSLLLVMAACRKDSHSNKSIEGSWKMIEVKAIGSREIEAKPSDENRDVLLYFAYNPGLQVNGTLSGFTGSNHFSGDFSTPDDVHISLNSFWITDANETHWGKLFRDNINEVNRYDLTGSRLFLKTGSRTLVFAKN